MLKKIRVIVASFFMIAITLLFLDYTGTIHTYLGWAAKVQFVPAVLSANVAVIAGVLLLTLLFGRVYCSAVCPLGIFQDKVSRLAGLGKKNRFSYRPPRKPLVVVRFAILALFAFAAVAGVSVVTASLEPYSAYGRMVSQIAGPLYKYGNNILAGFSERAGSYTFYPADVWVTGVGALAAAVVTLVIVGVFAAKSGRGFCNSVCPVGAFLAVVTKFSFVKQPIDKAKCVSCGVCAKNCKAGCIDPVNKEVDYLRCVSCCNCIDACPKGAVRYALRNPLGVKGPAGGNLPSAKKSSAAKRAAGLGGKEHDAGVMTADGASRRGLVTAAAAFALGAVTNAAARTYDFDGGLAPLEGKAAPKRKTPIIPPGADNARSFRKRCTGCQLCVSVCPNQALRPSSGLNDFMQPHMSFERGYCRPECVKCSQVCPTGAIRPITTAEKSSIQIGQAVWIEYLCVVNADNVVCDLCSRKCPTGAITMISRKADDEASLKVPMIDTARCIGCGACEQLCPSRPASAIYVEGVETHRTV